MVVIIRLAVFVADNCATETRLLEAIKADAMFVALVRISALVELSCVCETRFEDAIIEATELVVVNGNPKIIAAPTKLTPAPFIPMFTNEPELPPMLTELPP